MQTMATFLFPMTVGNRAGQLKESMSEQVAEARQLCQVAAQQRAAAEKLHAQLERQWEAIQGVDAQLKVRHDCLEVHKRMPCA